jgi:D-amino peptidase
MKRIASSGLLALLFVFATASPAATQGPLRIFISVDMEGIGGVGTSRMTSATGKDYATGRELMTAEVNTVVEAILENGPAQILVNDSHGDMQNLLHLRLDPRVEYIQGNNKPLGMVQDLDASFDAVIFLGYHARARTTDGFLAHTGSGAVKGLWIDGVEVGEGGMNAYYAGSYGVPVILAAGDKAFTEEIESLIPTRTVTTKTAIGGQVARLIHPKVVRKRLRAATLEALGDLDAARPLQVSGPVEVQIRFASTTRADIVQAVPGMRRVDGTTVAIRAEDMTAAYKLIRLMYKYISW